MNKLNYLKVVLLGAALTFMSTSCDDILQVEPQQSVSPEVATSSAEGIRAVSNRAYRAQMFEGYYGQRMMIAGDALADNAVSHPVTSGRYISEPQNSRGSGVGGWGRYSGINDINTVLKYAPTVSGFSDAERNRIVGGAYFLRALAYHDLVKVYAYEPNQIVDGFDHGVILRLEPTETVEQATDLKSRATVQATYEQIESDLLDAISYFEQNDGESVYYGNLAASYALLARVYLYWERWDDAIDYATLAINTSGTEVVDAADVSTMFTVQPNPESLFELGFTLSESIGVNTSLAAILTPQSHYDLVPSDEFLNTLDPADTRNDLYQSDAANYPELSSSRSGYRYVTKYESYVASYTDNVPVIRISEVYLTRAEAYAERDEAGDDVLAINDLNEIRTNRGLTAYTIATAPANLVDEILLERRRELAFEGHRWQDLKRKGRDVIKPAITGVPNLIYGQSDLYLSPIPNSQLSINPNLEPNPSN